LLERKIERRHGKVVVDIDWASQGIPTSTKLPSLKLSRDPCSSNSDVFIATGVPKIALLEAVARKPVVSTLALTKNKKESNHAPSERPRSADLTSTVSVTSP
jgi:hypothetical protein